MIALKEYNWFKRLGFYRKIEPLYGDSFVSIEEVLIERSLYGNLFGYNTSSDDNINMLKPRFIYMLSAGYIYDNLTKNQSSVSSVEELVNFMQGRVNEHTQQIDWNKKKFQQNLLDSRDDGYWGYITGRSRMGLFNEGLMQELLEYSRRPNING